MIRDYDKIIFNYLINLIYIKQNNNLYKLIKYKYFDNYNIYQFNKYYNKTHLIFKQYYY